MSTCIRSRFFSQVVCRGALISLASILSRMAPKRAPRKPTVQAMPVRLPLATSSSLLDQEHVVEAAAKQTRRRPSKTMDDTIQKMYFDNFKARGWPQESLDLVIRNGQSLRQHMTAAKLHHVAGGEPLGKLFYDSARSLYSDLDTPALRMKVLDPTEPEDQIVRAAIEALTNYRSDREPASAIFSSDYIPNQKSLVALFRAVHELQPTSSPVADFFIDLLSYCVRNDLHTKHKQIFDELRPRLDSALDKHWMCWKPSGLSASLWFDIHEPYIGAIVDKAALQRCFNTKSNWMEVSDDLAVVVQSAVGSRIFFPKYKSLAGQRVVAQIQTAVANHGTVEINAASVAQLRAICEANCTAAGKKFHDPFDLPIEIKMVYRGVDIKVMTSNLHEVFLYSVSCVIKSLAVDLGELDPLWCENELVPTTTTKPTCKIDAALLRTPKLARRAAMDLLTSEGQTGGAIKNTLVSKQQMLRSMDKDWAVEHHFFMGMVGDVGEAMLRSKILESLPKSDNDIPVAESYARISSLESTKLYSFVAVGAQVACAKVKDLVGLIQNKRQPKFPIPCSDFLTTIKERLGYFCVFSVGGSSSSSDTSTSRGRAAIQKYLEMAEAKVTASEEITLHDVNTLNIFSWLLETSETVRLKAITDTIMKHVMVEAASEMPKKKQKTGSKRATAEKHILKTKVMSNYFS
jgi:hypothetical protein